MCGRYVVAYDPQTLVSGFSLTRVQPFERRWNVTPQSPVPVVYETRAGERVAELMRWGLGGCRAWGRACAEASFGASLGVGEAWDLPPQRAGNDGWHRKSPRPFGLKLAMG